jgi:stearoyl-CoA desaturase (delta-9 desaturase)
VTRRFCRALTRWIIKDAARTQQLDWTNIVFLSLTPVIGVLGTAAYTWWVGFEWWMLALFLVLYGFVGTSICAGYHRYFSHKSYEASAPLKLFVAIFGSFAAQNTILQWSASHRTHHTYVDKDWDPYNIKRGFWWAHIIWIFHKNPDLGNFENARDLAADPIVQWQQRWYRLLVIGGGFGVPALIGAMFGDPVAGLLWGGFLRFAAVHHSTFFVNSLAHYWGARTYSYENSARDNWFVAFLTLGEGFHSFHHRFPADFRNGIRWFDWDPSKWTIQAMRALGLASDLKSTPAPLIEKARMQAAFKRWQERLEHVPAGRAEEIRRKLDAAVAAIEEAISLWRERRTRRASKKMLRFARREWRSALRMARQAA